ncbi:hypothetical protein [Roseiconus lacunae]|uniref:hypothetical protein n=1 Tax=Roseiconus lacunae TaxID=2605694 RepID=UPI0011F23BA3|nr:hypothetical protein [Roseiconus lacunae]
MTTKRISAKVHAHLLRAAERSVHKHEDEMLDKKIPVSAKILQELGFELTPETQAALQEQSKQRPIRGRSNDVVQLVDCADYLNKLQDYKPDPPRKGGINRAAKPTGK